VASTGDDRTVGLVLAGGGARGAYEMGALSVLLPALDARGWRPRVIVGTSVGALNAAFLAATADRPIGEVVDQGLRIWREMRFEEVLAHLRSAGTFRRLARYVGQFLQLPHARLEALLDPAPLGETLRQKIPVHRIAGNVAAGKLDAAAVIATSAATSRSVVFHAGGGSPARDDRRGIDYVETPLADEHVRASAAIPGVFPAVHVPGPEVARGWYFDGGTRLNTPIKPALALGTRRVVVIALNAIVAAPEKLASEHRPDALEGAGQLIQGLLVDPLAHDMATLSGINELVGPDTQPDGKQYVPYVFVAPRERDAIGRRARAVFDRHYDRLTDVLRLRDVPILGRAVAGGADPIHGELLSYLFFAPEFAEALIELGRENAQRWLDEHPREDPWAGEPVHVARAR
jgi:NTE family protein